VSPASLVVSYNDDNSDGLVDGTSFRAADVKFYSHTGVLGASWTQDVPTFVDLARRTLTGLTSHFSFFTITGSPTVTLSSVHIYPVPFKPNGSNPSEGRPFSASNPKTGIVFINLPPIVTIKIYNLAGSLVARYSATNGSGTYQWDVRTDSGRDVASGTYIAVISSPGYSTISKKLVIIR